jgi:AcrR family transcriptional regulator
MRRPAWKLAPPADDREARELLTRAAVRCIERDGIDQTSVASIAREAGVTRPTLYRYFPNGQDLIRSAAVLVGGGILDHMDRYLQRFRSPEDRVIESMMFIWREIPKDPFLYRIFRDQAGTPPVDILFSEMAIEFSARILSNFYGEEGTSAADAAELAELFMRLLWTFVLAPGVMASSEAKLRASLRRWVPPLVAAAATQKRVARRKL